MKIINLEIEGLNSFVKKATIDFHQLFERGMFGIFGQTGSGKSSILDAIFLALYGKILRTKKESEFINSRSKTARVRLIFEMDINKESKFFVVQREYTIVDEQKNISKKATLYGNEDNKLKLITRGDDNVTEKIKEIIGFGDEEFQRFIALPQGQFAKFLKDTSKDKIETVAKIFNLEKYGNNFVLNLKDAKSKGEQRLAYLKGFLQQYEKTDENTFKSNEENLRQLKEKAKQKALEYSQNKKAHLEIEKILSFQAERDSINKQIAKLNLRKAVFDEKMYKLNILKTSYRLAPFNSKLQILNEEKDSLEERKEELTKSIVTVSNNYIKAISNNDREKTQLMVNLAGFERRQALLLVAKEEGDLYSKLESDKSALITELIGKREKLEIIEEEYENCSYILESSCKLFNQMDAFIENSKAEKDIVNIARTYEKLKLEKLFNENILSNVDAELKELAVIKQKALDELIKNDNELSKQKNTLSKVNSSLKELFGEDEDASTAIEKSAKELSMLRCVGEIYLDNKQKATSLKEDISEANKQIKEDKLILENITLDIESTESKIKYADKELEKILLLKERYISENLIDALREDLKDGDNCPVCANEVSVLKTKTNKTDITNFKEQMSDTEDEIFKLKQLKDELIVSKSETEVSLDMLSGQVEEWQKTLAVINKKQKSIEKDFAELAGINKEKLNEIISKQQNVVDKLVNLTRVLSKTKEMAYLKERICIKNSANIDFINKQEKTLLLKKQTIEDAINNISIDIFNFEKSNSLLVDDGIKKYDSRVKEQEKLRVQTNAVLKQLAKQIENKEKAYKNFYNASMDIRVNEANLDNIVLRMESIHNNFKALNIKGFVASEIAEVLSKIQTIREKLSIINNQEAELLKQETKLKLEKASIIAEISIKLKEIQNAEEEFKGLCKLAKITKEQMESSVIYDDIVKLEEWVNDYKEDLDDAKDDLVRVNKILNGRQASKEDLTKAVKAIKECEQAYIETANSASLLEIKMKKDKENIKKFAYFKEEYEGLKLKLKDIDELVQLNENGAILKYITEEYILNITEKANKYFANLTNGRYQLLFDEDFVVIDNLSGGTTRSVGTLSGGETFLASLSLAIAIVETLFVIRDKQLDFVFLDEGFGTLDESSLEMVLTAIRNLIKTKLVFGLISHEDLVKYNIPTRIEVIKATSEEGSKVEIVL